MAQHKPANPQAQAHSKKWLNWSLSEDISDYQTRWLRKTIPYCWHKRNDFDHNIVAQLCNWTVWVDLAAWLSGIQQTPFICSSSGWETTSSRLLSFLLAPWLDSSLVLWSDARTKKESPAHQIQMLFLVARNARIASMPLAETEPHAWNWNWARGVVGGCEGGLCRCAGNHFLVLQTRARAPRKRFLQRCSSSSSSSSQPSSSSFVRSKQRWLQRKDILRSISCELRAAAAAGWCHVFQSDSWICGKYSDYFCDCLCVCVCFFKTGTIQDKYATDWLLQVQALLCKFKVYCASAWSLP